MTHLWENKGNWCEACATCRTQRKWFNGQWKYRKSHKAWSIIEPYCKGTKVATKPVSPPPTAPTMAKGQVNHVAIVVDESGSMAGYEQLVKNMLHDNIVTMREETTRFNQLTYLSVFFFDARGGANLRPVFEHTNVMGLDPNQVFNYQPHGGTPLFEATMDAAASFTKTFPNPGSGEAFLLMVITDGQENQSRASCDAAALQRTLKTLQATDKWTFTFALPKGQKNWFATFAGVPVGNITEWAGQAEFVRTSQATSAGTQSYYATRSTGKTRVNNFYEVDLSGVKSTDLSKLNNVTSNFKFWTVEKETDIKSFVEQKTKSGFMLGAAYYQLNKPEKIQSHKELLLAPLNKKEIYRGDVRGLLGFPSYEVKVKPGNLGNLKLFVQSTSTNRKLVRGTVVAYDTSRLIPLTHTW